MTWPGKFPIVRANAAAEDIQPPDVILGSLMWKWHRLLVGDPALVVSGASVTQWPCKNNNEPFLQISASRKPQYNATSFNGGPGITADGVDDVMFATATTPIVGGSRPYMWLVGQRLSGGAAFDTLLGIYNMSFHRLFIHSTNTNTWQFERRTTGNNVFTDLGVADNNRHLWETGFTTGGLASQTVDGVSSNSTATLAIQGGVSTATLFATESITFPANFQVAEIVIANDDPSDLQKDQMRAYFGSIPHYGLTIA